MARLFDDAQSEYLSVNQAVLAAVPLTMACWFKVDTNAVEHDLMAFADADGDNDIFHLFLDGSNQVLAELNQNGAGWAAAVATTTWNINTWHHAAGVFSGSTERYAYLDGGSKGSNTTYKVPTAGNIDITSLGVLARLNKVNYTSGSIAFAAIWNAALTDAEIAALGKGFSPLLIRPQNLVAYWPLLKSDKDIVGAYDMTAYNTPSWANDNPPIIMPAPIFYSILSAPVAYTLTAAGGSYAQTGTAADLLKGSKVSAGTGAYAQTGTAADLLRGLLISAAGGSYAQTGTAADLLKGSKVSAGTGAYAKTGTAADLLRGLLISAAGGSYALSGADVDFIRAYLLSAASGSYVLTGSDVNLIYSQGATIICDAGSYLITGTAATLKYNRVLPAAAGAYAKTGTAADLLRGLLISAAGGSYALTGTAADLLRGLLISAAGESYALSGADVDFIRAYLLPAAGGTISVNGQTVTLTYSGAIIPSGLAAATFTVQKPGIAFTNNKPTIIFS